MNKRTEEQLREDIESDPDNAELYYELAQVIYAVKDDDGTPNDAHEASDQLQKAILIDPFNGKYHFFRAEISAHTSSQDWEEELNRCIHLKYKVKECKAILKTRDQVWKNTFDWDKHINEHFEKVKNDPSAENYYLLGRSFVGKNHEEGVQYYIKALEIDPNHASSLTSMGFHYQNKGMLNEALPYFLKSIEHAPTAEKKATYYSWSGSLYEKMGDYQNTLDIRLKAWNEFGGDYQSLAMIGDCYLRLGRLEEAEKTLLEVVKDDLEDGNYHPTYCNLVVLYAKLQKFDKSKFYCDKGLKQFPDSAHLHHYKGIFYFMTGNMEEAKRTLKIAIIHQNDYFPAYMMLGSLAMEEKDFETALENYKMVLKYRDDLLIVHEALVDIYTNLGNEKKAEFHNKKIQELRIKELLN